MPGDDGMSDTDVIRDLQLRIHYHRVEAEELEEVLKDLKVNHIIDIDANAKELGLTNETKRKIALDARLDTDETYCRLLRDLNAKRDTIALLQIDEQFEQRKFKRWFVYCLAGTGDMDVSSEFNVCSWMRPDAQVGVQ
jgi:hypothetical protein